MKITNFPIVNKSQIDFHMNYLPNNWVFLTQWAHYEYDYDEIDLFIFSILFCLFHTHTYKHIHSPKQKHLAWS